MGTLMGISPRLTFNPTVLHKVILRARRGDGEPSLVLSIPTMHNTSDNNPTTELILPLLANI